MAGVDTGAVRAWLAHEFIATINRHLHFLGTGADLAGLERLNRPRPALAVLTSGPGPHNPAAVVELPEPS